MQAVQHYLTIDLLRQTYDQKIYIHNGAVGHRLTVILTQGGKVIDLPDAEHGIVQLVYQKPDGTKSDVEMTVTGKAASVMIPRAATDTVGEVDCEVRVYTTDAEGTWTTTPRFTLDVENVIYDEDAQEEIVSAPTVYEQIVSSEAERREYETNRRNAETTRGENEQTRRNQEQTRQDQEQTRQDQEQIRQDNETARIAGGAITRADVDSALSGTSVNPVQNKVIKAALDLKQNTADIQTSITSGGLNPVTSKAIYNALAGKQGTLTFDDTPTQDSTKPVTSGGIYTAIQNGASVVTGSFVPDPAMTGTSAGDSDILQVGSMVHAYIVVNKGSGFGYDQITLGELSGVAKPNKPVVVTPCLTTRANGDYHCGMAAIWRVSKEVTLISADPDDEMAYIDVSYHAAT